MPNALDSGMPPPAQAQSAAQGNGLQQSGPPANGTAPPAAPPAPPTHEQTVAALRHFDAIKGELATLLKDPALGRSTVKGAIIDGTTKLVAERIISAPQAVQQLAQVPSDPQAQRKWLQNMMQQTVQAEQAVLAHHAVGFAGQGPLPTPSNSDDHMQHMSALLSNYSGAKN